MKLLYEPHPNRNNGRSESKKEGTSFLYQVPLLYRPTLSLSSVLRVESDHLNLSGNLRDVVSSTSYVSPSRESHSQHSNVTFGEERGETLEVIEELA